MQWRPAAGQVNTGSRTPIPRQAEATMTVPYAYVEAARFLGATVASGAVVGLIVAVLRMVRRG